MVKARGVVKDDLIDLIPYVELTDEEKLEHEKIMRRGNRVLLTYHARIRAKMGGKRYSRTTFRKELWAAVENGGSVVLHGVGIAKSDIALILKVKAIEWTMLCSVAALVTQLARKWVRNKQCGNLTFGDLYDEGTLAVINAIYGYDRDKIRFSTYCQVIIHHRFENVTNNAKPLSPWSQHGKKLYGQFSKLRTKLGNLNGREASFEDIVKLMDLDEKSIRVLRSTLATVVNGSELVAENGKGRSDFSDLNIQEPQEEFGVRVDYEAILKSTPMSEWERTVLNAYLTGGRGWATEVARNHINPDSGEQYSRRAPRLALDRVLGRIKQQFEEQEGNVFADAA